MDLPSIAVRGAIVVLCYTGYLHHGGVLSLVTNSTDDVWRQPQSLVSEPYRWSCAGLAVQW